MARTQFTFTFTNAQPGAAVGFNFPAYADSSTPVADGPSVVLDSTNTVSVWADSEYLIARTVDGRGVEIVGVATVAYPTQTIAAGTAGQNPFGGSVAPGVPVVRAFPFAFNTAGLVAGHSLYTPTIGDLILDAVLFVNNWWDGTTPFADIGTFTNGTQGWFFNQGQFGTGVDLTDGLGHASSDTLNKVNGAVVRLSAFDVMTNAVQALQVSATDLVDKADASNASSSSLPILIQQADPIKVCVSTTGATDGSATAATRGDCTLYLVTCTPAT